MLLVVTPQKGAVLTILASMGQMFARHIREGMSACRDPQADVAAFQADGGNILVGTPGRLADVFERSRVLDPKHLEVLVLDEADRLLDAGYGRHLENLMRKLPKQRRTGMDPFARVILVYLYMHFWCS